MRALLVLLLTVELLAGLLAAPAASQPLEHFPGDGQVVATAQPVITVQLPPSSSYDFAAARVWVNHREVTSDCLRTAMFISYRPLQEMAAGTVSVRVLIPNRHGSPLHLAWSFVLKPIERIETVTHSPASNLGEYDTLVVHMMAKPGGRAWFDIVGFKDHIPMKEVTVGHYEGSYLVKPGDFCMAAPVRAYLRLGPHLDSALAPTPVTLFANIFRVKVTDPPDGSKVPLQFTIKGRTRPFARVTAVANLGFDAGTPAPNSSTGQGGTGGIDTTADKNGFFSLQYGVPLKLPNLQVVLSVFAVDKEGHRSVPTILHYRF